MRTAPAALLLGAALLAGACTEVDQAVDEVGQVVDEVTTRADEAVTTARYCAQALQVAEAIANRDVDAAVDAGRALVEVAPPELRGDAEVVLAAAERAQGGDLSALDDAEVQAAADRLRAETQQTCNPAG